MAYVVVAGAGLAWVVLRDGKLWPRSHALTFLFVAAGIGAFAMVPLPRGLLRIVSPTIWAWTVGSLPDAGIPMGAVRPAAVSIPKTAMAMAMALGHLMVLLTVAALARKGAHTVRWLAVMVSVVGFLVGLFSILQMAVGAHWLGHYGPFINGNHAGTFLAMCAVTGVGLAITDEDVRWRSVGAFCGGVSAVSAFFSYSRGAVVALIVGLGAVLLFNMLRSTWPMARSTQRRDWAWWTRIGLVVGLVGLAALYAFWLGPSSVAREVQTLAELDLPSDYRMLLWSDSLDVVRAFGLVGTGPGGFPSAFASFRTFTAPVWAQSAESEVIGAFVEIGVVGGLVLMVGLVWFLVAGVQRLRAGEQTIVGALAACVVVCVHSVYDFPLHTTAVGALAAVSFGVILGRMSRERAAHARVKVGFLVGAAILALGAVAETWPRDNLARNLRRDPGRYADYVELAESSDYTEEQRTELLALAHARNPTEPFGVLARARWLANLRHYERANELFEEAIELQAQRGADTRATEAMKYRSLGEGRVWQGDGAGAAKDLEKALELDPRRVDTHLLLADAWLLQGNVDEVERAWASAYSLDRDAAREHARRRAIGEAANAARIGDNDQARAWIGAFARADGDVAWVDDAVHEVDLLSSIQGVPLWNGPATFDVPVITRRSDFPKWEIPMRLQPGGYTLELIVEAPRRPGDQMFVRSGGRLHYAGVTRAMAGRYRFSFEASPLTEPITAVGYDTRGLEGEHRVISLSAHPLER